jgi:hypothetical protein
MNMSMRTMQMLVAGCYVVGVIIVSVVIQPESALLSIGLTVALVVGALLTIRYLRHLKEG